MTALRGYGVDTIFGIPGTHNLELYRHLPELGIHPVTTRHEQGAGYAADGWAQQTGLPGVVVTTSGPGLLNALSAAATAYCESRPMIVLSPGPALGQEGADRGTLHETKDTSGAAAAVMQWSRRVASAEEAVAAVHDAFELFRTSRPRPVHIEIPLDVLEAEADLPAELLAARPAPAPALADADSIAAAVEALSAASDVVVLAGGGSLRAGDAVRRLVELLDAPVVTTLNGKAAVPESHPLSLGADIRTPAAQKVCSGADVLLVLGSKVGEAELWGGLVEPAGTVVRIDVLDGQMDANLSADVRLVGDSAAVVPQLVAALEQAGVAGRGRGAAGAAALREEVRAQAAETAPPLVALTTELVAGMPADTIVAGDSSQITYFGTSSIAQDRPHSFLYMPAYATLGYGLPAAIGAKVAAPERPVVCVAGDGALMFAIQELATAVEQRLDLVVVCVDNGGYAEIKQNEADRGIAPIGVDLHQPDWAALGVAFGGHGTRVAAAADLAPAVRDAITAGGVHVVHVPLGIFGPVA
ncbi:thiamine pyrophosphate-binding protein [Nocardioides albidus]|uniref:Thiamine pyrophosphate-binding protein n=2 Tax=Nocardioides albidus TaxID=1517589 RepID=A0A5C4VR10_9ACTN|nr:thiamine pyrophosphate-binding protein [Nocardioides albidus]